MIKNLSNKFEIEWVTDSKNKDYLCAMKIYNKMVTSASKTDTNQINQMIDSPDKYDLFDFYIFVLKIDNKVSGFIETAYIKETKVTLFDYICIESSYYTNASFFPTLSLVQNFFIENNIDVDYWCFELENIKEQIKFEQDAIHLKKLVCMEGFVQLKMPYKHCNLGINKEESSYEVNLCIKSAEVLHDISSEKFIRIIKSIYYDYNLEWYRNCISGEDFDSYKKLIEENFNELRDNMKKTESIKPKGIHCDIDKINSVNLGNSTPGQIPASKSKVVYDFLKNCLLLLVFLGISAVFVYGICYAFEITFTDNLIPLSTVFISIPSICIAVFKSSK